MQKQAFSLKALWSYVNDICNNNNSKSQTAVQQLEKNGHRLERKKEIAQAFNDYFSGVGQEYADKIEQPDEYKENDCFLDDTIFPHPTNEMEVKRNIGEFKERKSVG
ncbi:hypothetical protein HHI36_007330 [Cryptolaemus montrouzieri]|uniref:Uncharacterized protein n=1 Tax=Cryptolaemus montrouzieri TaxID=559131 RepID=A0ABD2MPL6_9CUCU